MNKRKKQVIQNDKRREYKEYLLSPRWKQFRIDALNFFGHKCSKCNSTEKLELHHKTYKNLFKETFEDVQVLCKSHRRQHHKKKLWKNGVKSKYINNPHYDSSQNHQQTGKFDSTCRITQDSSEKRLNTAKLIALIIK